MARRALVVGLERSDARTAALKADQTIYDRLPIPAGAVVTAHSDDAATAMGNGNVTIGFGSGWTIQPPPGTELCASAAAFDAAMAKAGWERFTTQSPAGRERPQGVLPWRHPRNPRRARPMQEPLSAGRGLKQFRLRLIPETAFHQGL